MVSVQDIRELVSNYVSGNLSAADLANSFTPALKAAISSKDDSVKDLALAVHAEISHFFNGLTSEAELRTRLAPIGDFARPGLASVSFHVYRPIEADPLSLSNPHPAPVAALELICA